MSQSANNLSILRLTVEANRWKKKIRAGPPFLRIVIKRIFFRYSNI